MILAGSILSFAIHVQGVQNSKRSMIYVFCSFLSILAIMPFWIMIVNATRSSQAIQQSVSVIPGTYLKYNWNVLSSKNFDVSIGFKNSAIIAFGSTILSVYFSAMTAYGFKVYQFKGSKFLYAVVLAIIMIPGQVTGTGFYMFMYQLGWIDSYLPLIIPSIASASTVFFFRQYLEANFQISLVEAARIDGCGEFRTFNRIVLPIMVPAMATMGIMAVIGAWNNYLTPLMLLTKSTMKTLPMMVQELRGDIYRTEYGSIYLGLTMTALPLLIVYFAFSKYIIAGVALGGVKE
ncbi:MAG: carbohydrate ABC transporter permease [Clostridia bacterium]|nr:carbohydrate ABC transporter permease [Clostridia bacterium]